MQRRFIHFFYLNNGTMDSVKIARRCAIPGEHIVVNGLSGERGAFFNRQAPTPSNDPENCIEWKKIEDLVA
jgi:hypothetical protein